MFKKFIIKSYQLENKKWVPTVDLMESENDNLSIKITGEVSIRNKEFDSKEEADKFISDYYTVRGYTKG